MSGGLWRAHTRWQRYTQLAQNIFVCLCSGRLQHLMLGTKGPTHSHLWRSFTPRGHVTAVKVDPHLEKKSVDRGQMRTCERRRDAGTWWKTAEQLAAVCAVSVCARTCWETQRDCWRYASGFKWFWLRSQGCAAAVDQSFNCVSACDRRVSACARCVTTTQVK